MSREHTRPRRSELTDVEKKVLLWLAEKGPKTGYELFRKDRLISSSTWHDVKRKLEGPVLIRELIDLKAGVGLASNEKELAESQEKYQALKAANQRSDPYWLTIFGIGEVLGLGANPKRMLAIMEENEIDDETSEAMLDMAIAGGSNWARKTFDARVADYFNSGLWTIKLPIHPLSQYRILAAVMAHKGVAREIGDQFARDAERTRAMAQLFLSEEAWNKEAKRLQQKATDPIFNLVLTFSERKYLTHDGALQVLMKFGMNQDEAAAVIQRMLEVGQLMYHGPEHGLLQCFTPPEGVEWVWRPG